MRPSDDTLIDYRATEVADSEPRWAQSAFPGVLPGYPGMHTRNGADWRVTVGRGRIIVSPGRNSYCYYQYYHPGSSTSSSTSGTRQAHPAWVWVLSILTSGKGMWPIRFYDENVLYH